MNFKEDILRFRSEDVKEISEKEVILDFIEKNSHDVLLRKNKIAHLTASSMIFNESMDKVLMIYHNIYESWSWTGGHADGDKDLLYVAMKEAREETGVTWVRPLTDEILSLDIIPVVSHEKRGEYIPSHLHLSVAYALLTSEKETLFIKPDENSGVGWFKLSELETAVNEPELLIIYEKIINRVQSLRII